MVRQLRIHLLTRDKPVFRDIEIPEDMTLEDLHNAIMQSFGLPGNEMASFYLVNDDFEMLDEIPLFPMDDESVSMERVSVGEVLNPENPRLAYVYDFMNMWHFLVELMGEAEEVTGQTYPRLVYAHGPLPESPPEVNFEILHDQPFDEPGFDDLRNPFDEFDDYDDNIPGDWY
ncbi:MAG: plasmid pRiA4b ORF-3 family protein [Chlorobi bacterium]|nr:plasmid pRiA4b ORF-3 family protein [Chlorobiota bacterium]